MLDNKRKERKEKRPAPGRTSSGSQGMGNLLYGKAHAPRFS